MVNSILKILNIKHGNKSIRHRITRAVLTICIITLLVSAAFSTFALYRLQALLAHNGRDIGASASQMSADVLLEQSVSNAQDFIAAKVDVMDAYLKNIIDNLTIVRDYTANIFNTPGRFIPGSVPYFNRVPQGVFATYYMLDPSVVLSPEVQNEINMLAGMMYPAEAMMKLHSEIFSIYIVTENGVVVFFDDSADTKGVLLENDIILRQRSWYLNAKETGYAVITDTYEDATGYGLVVTFSIPVYGENGEFKGVIGADLSIRELSNVVMEITSGGVEFVMLLGKDRVIASSTVGEAKGAYELPLGIEEIYNNKNGFFTLSVINIADMEQRAIESYVIWDSLVLTDWKFVGVTSIAGIVAPVEEMKASINTLTGKAVTDAQKTATATSIATLLSIAGILIFGFFYARKTSNSISSPLLSLTKDAIKIGQGELDHFLDVKTGDEIETLAGTINKMVTNIKYITGEKERISAELDVATKIQASLLPCIFPAFPHRDEFDIYASMQPAKEVGGDFYDFFLIDEDTLAVVMADVSDKGVPAALFMVIAKTLIKNNAQEGKSPKEVFEVVNNLLCENNEASMFVTAFLGYLDIPSGKFTYVNAGHNPPLFKTDGQFNWIKTKPGFVLAGMEDMFYKEYEVVFKPGDKLFLYTDGITEAMNNENALFGNNRLFDTLNAHLNSPLEEIDMSIKREIENFVEGAEQADDITMLTLKYKGFQVPADKKQELIIEAKIENMGLVLDFVNEQLTDCPPKIYNQIGIAVDEIFSNIARYAYTSMSATSMSDNTGLAVIRVTTGDEIVIEFEDKGLPYNPLEAKEPDLTADIDEREPGGLGIFMLKKIMDTVEYRYDNNKNILLIRKSIK